MGFFFFHFSVPWVSLRHGVCHLWVAGCLCNCWRHCNAARYSKMAAHSFPCSRSLPSGWLSQPGGMGVGCVGVPSLSSVSSCLELQTPGVWLQINTCCYNYRRHSVSSTSNDT